MKGIKKIFASFLAICLITTSFAACSTSTVKNTASDNVSTATSTVKKQISGKIVYRAMWNESEAYATVIKAAVKAFQADYPAVTVDVQWIGRSNSKSAPIAIKAGQQVDIFDNVNFSVDPTLFADLTNLLNDQAYGMPGKTVKESIQSSFLTTIKIKAAAAGLTSSYAVPSMSSYAVSYFYNKALFAKAGITTTPKTWTEFLADCQKLVSKGITPITTDDAYMDFTYDYYLSRLIGSTNVYNLGKNSTSTVWKDTTNSAAILKTLQAMEDLHTKGYLSKNVNTNKYPAGQQEFALGNAAMYLNASWFPGEIAATAGKDFKYGEFAFPTVTGGVEGLDTNTVSCIPMAVSSQSTNKQAAMEFIRYLLGQKFQKQLSDAGFVPCTINTAWPAALADQQSIVSNTKTIVQYQAAFSSTFISATVDPQFNSVLTGATTAQKAYDAIMAKVAD
jgi:raffinose/stachyose/melibiose transport system substrate-binding protein